MKMAASKWNNHDTESLQKAESLRFESGLEGRPKVSCYGQIWRPQYGEERKTIVVGVHGFAEYGGNYGPTANFLNRQGYHLAMLDFRGYGRSDGKRSFVVSFEEYVDDLEAFFLELKLRFPDRPFFLFSHSMGGLVSLQWMLLRKFHPEIKGLFMSSPLFGVRFSWLQTLIRYASAAVIPFWPTLPFPTSHFTGGRQVSKDPAYLKQRANDPLINGYATPSWALAMDQAVREVMQSGCALTIPVFVGMAGVELIVSNEKTRSFYAQLKAPQKELKVYPGLRHELLRDVEREFVRVDLMKWIDLCDCP